MSLRFITLRLPIIRSLAGKILVLCLLFHMEAGFGQNGTSFDDTKKEADKFFKEEDYVRAYKLYSQLVSNFPKDAEYNYRLGVCMIYAEPDKKKCIPYLKMAAGAGSESPKESEFYLGKAYHINYQFDEAIKHYNTYKLSASAAQVKKLQVDREIKSAANGKHLLSNLTDLEVMSKTQLPESDYFRSYKKIGGKLLVKPDEFRTGTDKKKKEKSVVFLPSTGDVVYFSSYGDDDKTGRDIYVAYKQSSGAFGKPEKVKGINTEFDEDYPFLHPDGKTLYFASKGYNSMGGYDIFKSVYNESTASWEAPVNMEFPINSPDDDYLFVTDSLETIAYFSTGRQSIPGKIDVLKVKTKRRPMDILAVTGNVIPGSPEYPLACSITIKDLFSDATIGNYNSEENGEYSLEVPNGGKLVFTVETPGLETQSAQVNLPFTQTSKPFRQTISYESGKLKVLNYFDEPANDEDYIKYLKVIEKKAKLDVNEGENKIPDTAFSEPAVATKTANSTKNTTSTGNTDSPTKQNLSNSELSKIAKQDAGESKKEASDLNKNYLATKNAGDKQKQAADKKLTEANEALNKANELTDQDEKRVALETANEQVKIAEGEKNRAEKLLTFADALDQDAKHKKKEADLNDQYARELDKAVKNKNSRESLAKLEELQKQITEATAYKSASEEITNAMKNDIEQKEKEISEKETSNASIKSNLEEITTAISDKETELAETKRKKEKQKINNEISELKVEQEEKQKQIVSNDAEIKTLNEELAYLKNDLEATSKISSESIAISDSPASEEKVTALSLQKKYQDKLSISDLNSASSIEETTSQLTLYNSELASLIAEKKQALSKTKNTKTKQQLAAEIKQLESTKNSNQQQISANNKKIEDLNKKSSSAAQQDVATAAVFEPITASTGAEAVTKLEKLDKQLVTNDNENFDYNGYQDSRAQSLKVEADTKINDAIARQKKLKDEIASSKTALQGGGSTSSGNSEELNKEAEGLFSSAQKRRNESKSLKGDAKNKAIAEAKELDLKAQDKLIEADEISLKETQQTSSINQENIQNLINEGKSSEEDVTRAKSLNEEAMQALKKAGDLRLEAGSIENKGARLGSLSNAMEKEAEALEKQKKAVELLAKSNPSYQLKTTTASENNGGNTDVGSTLSTVNAGLSELASIKTESYQKLYEANEIEIEGLTNNIKVNQSKIDNTPSLKSSYIAANGKIENAKSLKQKSDNGATQDEKLNNLIAAVKNQNEGIKQLSNLSSSLGQPTLNTTTPPVVVDDPLKALGDAPINTPVLENNENDPLKALGNTNVQDSEPLQIPQANKTEEPKTTETESPTEQPAVTESNNAEVVSLSSLAGTDTTSGQVINYLDKNIARVRSAQAGPMVQNSLGELKKHEAENKRLDGRIAELNYEIANGTSASQDPEALNKKSDEIMLEAETYNKQAADLKEEANGKTGEERDYTLAKAREIEINGQNKMIEASEYRKTANENTYIGNSNAIDELLEKAKQDNPELAQSVEEKRAEFPALKTQIKNLRDEANALNNTAKLGAISNAEEKEMELIQKQNAILDDLKNQYPDYVVKPYTGGTPEERTAELEKKKNTVRQGQISELINLINAFSLEYESIKNQVPSRLNTEQENIRQNAESLNSESKNLLVKASQEPDENEKVKQLTLAAKAGNAAITQLNKVLPKGGASDDIKGLTEIGNQIVESNSDGGAFDTENTSGTAAKAVFKTDGLEIKRGNAYSVAKPIPINARMADGLIFRVQIGAFKTQIPDNSFKGLSPLNGETTSNGYIRYTAGNFEKIENANAVKNDLRNLGYSDAFVVVYYNGRRITLAEAMEIMKQEGKTIDSNAPQTAGITANTNVPKAAANPVIQESVVVSKELEQTDGLLYTIQVGVYARQVSKPQLLRLTPIFREQLSGGLFRYTAGIYNNPEKLLMDKDKVVSLGIRDAFVSAYLNGKRIPFAEAKEKQNNDQSIRMEKENPIVFSEATTSTPQRNDNPLEQLAGVATGERVAEPFTNGVKEYPLASPENGVKSDESGISYKVQIGAFSKQVPEDVAAKFSAIKSWPVENKRINGLYIYNVGNFSELKFAKQLKDELVALGITDAFLTVYKDGTKLYGAAAESYLRN